MPEDWVFQASVKFGANGDMLNVRANDSGEFGRALADATDHAPDIRILSSALNENYPPGGTLHTTPTEPQATQQRNTSGAPVCAHGLQRTYKEGVSAKNNKPWKAWMCAAAKNGPVPQCAPEFV